jgi:hypothetical protein
MPTKSALKTRIQNDVPITAPAALSRSNKVMGQYWRTFRERKNAGAGFWGALFGRGMRRANAQSQAQAQARAGVTAFPREPGVNYDDTTSSEAFARYGTARQAFEGADHDADEGASKLMERAHVYYDHASGSMANSIDPALDTGAQRPEALAEANKKFGSLAFKMERSQRKKPIRVGFKDGLNDPGSLIDPDAAQEAPKVRPTGVRFHPTPMGTAAKRNEGKRSGWHDGKDSMSDLQAMQQAKDLWPLRRRLFNMSLTDQEKVFDDMKTRDDSEAAFTMTTFADIMHEHPDRYDSTQTDRKRRKYASANAQFKVAKAEHDASPQPLEVNPRDPEGENVDLSSNAAFGSIEDEEKEE